MNKLDDLLEQKIQLLQTGQTADDIIKDLPQDASELIPLIRLASDARAVTRPILTPQIQQKQKDRVVSKVYNLRDGNTRQENTKLHSSWLPHRTADRRWKPPVKYLPAYGTVALAIIAVSILGLFLTNSANANFVTITNTTGLVEVSQNPSTSSWKEIHSGDKILQGQTIRTDVNTTATIQYIDGSYSTLNGSSEIRLEHIGRSMLNTIQVDLFQESGVTTYSIVPIRGQDGYFRVKTPYGTASVHGTVFQVDVSMNSRFSVTQGKVSVTANQKEVFLTNGQATIVQADTSPQEPAYQFTFHDKLSSTGDIWTAGDISFQVPAGSLNGEIFQPGDNIIVTGRIQNGEFIADRITREYSNDSEIKKITQMTGVIESISSNQWTISGQTVLVDDSTRLSDGIKIGDPVSIHFRTAADHSIHALSITLLSSPGAGNGETSHLKRSTSEVTTTSLSESTLQDQGQTTTPVVMTESTPLPTTAVDTENQEQCSSGVKKPPVLSKIAEKYQRSLEEVSGWFCKGYEIDEIEKVYDLNTQSGTSVSDLFNMRQSGLGWGQIEQALKEQSSRSENSKNKKTRTH